MTRDMQMKWLLSNEGKRGDVKIIGCDCACYAAHWALVGDVHWDPFAMEGET